MAEKSTSNNQTLFPIAMATLFQGGCLLAAAFLRNKVNFVPKDPVVLVGAVYALTGVDIMIADCFMNGDTSLPKPEP